MVIVFGSAIEAANKRAEEYIKTLGEVTPEIEELIKTSFVSAYHQTIGDYDSVVEYANEKVDECNDMRKALRELEGKLK